MLVPPVAINDPSGTVFKHFIREECNTLLLRQPTKN